MSRICLKIEYDGTSYAGWQRQDNALAVQEVIEDALFSLLKERVTLTGASRTDSGVHALCQMAHFDTVSRIPPEKYCYALNTMLPGDIRIADSFAANEDFHARFSSIGKVYRYSLRSAEHDSALTRLTRAHTIYALDDALMSAELRSLIGRHDFAAFAAAGSVVKDTVREIYNTALTRREAEVDIYILGDGFLYNMVRIIAGTLIYVGTGKTAPGAFIRAMDSGSRLDLGITAPPNGLTLMEVIYEKDRLDYLKNGGGWFKEEV